MNFFSKIANLCRNPEIQLSKPDKKPFTASPELENLLKLLQEGYDSVEEQKSDSSIMILGESGVGKSSLAYLLAGKNLKIIRLAETDNLALEIASEEEKLKGIVIGHKNAPQTIIPGKFEDSKRGCVVWDCPGFKEGTREPSYDLLNVYLKHRIIEVSRKIKFLLMMPHFFFLSRAQNAIRALENFSNFFDDVEELNGSLCLVITHVPSDKSVESLRKTLLNIHNEDENINPKTRKLIKVLSDKVEIFYELKEEGILQEKEYAFLSTALEKLMYYDNHTSRIEISIPQNCLVLAWDFYEMLVVKFSESFKFLDKFTSNYCLGSVLIENLDKNLFVNEIHSIDISKEIYLREILKIQALGYILSHFNHWIDLIHENNLESLLTCIHVKIGAILDVMSHFEASKKNNLLMQEQTKFNYKNDMKFQANALNFFIKVLRMKQSAKDYEKIKNILMMIVKKLEQEIKISTFTMNICLEEKNADYYEKVIGLLSKYDENKEIQIKISQAYLLMSKILFEKKILLKSVITAINSFIYNEKSDEAIQMINQILIKNSDCLNILKNERQFEIIHKIFLLRNKEINLLFKEIHDTYCNFLDDWQYHDTFEFIEKSVKIYHESSKIVKVITENIVMFHEEIKIFSNIITNFDEIYIKLGDQIAFLNDLYACVENEKVHWMKRSELISNWKTHFDVINKAKLAIYNKIKSIKSLKIDLDTEKYIKILEYTSFDFEINIEESNETIKTAQDPDFFFLKKLAHSELGKIYIESKQYEEAEKEFSILLQMDKSHKNYDYLEKIFILNGNKFQGYVKELIAEVLSRPCKELTYLFKEKVVFLLDDFFTNMNFFNPLKDHWDYLFYLKELAEILNFMKKFFNHEPSSDSFLEMLSSIQSILIKRVNLLELNEKHNKDDPTNLEKLVGDFDKNEELFGIPIFKQYLVYIQNLVLLKSNKIEVFMEILTSNAEMMEYQSILKRIELKMFNMKINMEEKNEEYFLKIISIFKDFPFNNEGIPLKTVALCECKLAEIAKNDNELVLKFYISAHENVSQFHSFCEQNNKVEKYKSLVLLKEVKKKLADFYFLMGVYDEAFYIYKDIDEDIKITQCFKNLKTSESKNFKFLEEKADYLAQQGFVDKSIAAYHEAKSFAPSEEDKSRIYKKIANVLENLSSKVAEFKQKSKEYGGN